MRPNPDREPGRGAYVDDPFGNRIELIADAEPEDEGEADGDGRTAPVGGPAATGVSDAAGGFRTILRRRLGDGGTHAGEESRQHARPPASA